jgi:HEAT repeat protein
MKRLLFVALLGCGDAREAPAPQPQPRSARVAPSAARAPAPRPALARPASTAALPDLAADLRDPDARVRAAAVRELAESDDPDPELLRAAVRDSAIDVSALALRGLGKLHASGAVGAEEMIGYARDAALPERVRAVAFNGLGIVPSAAAAEFLARSLAGGSMFERRASAILLQHQDPAVAMPALIAALGDADEGVRQLALEALRARSRGRDFGTDAAAWRAWWQSRSR